MADKCGYCDGETDSEMNCLAGCQNVKPARIVYLGRSKPMPMPVDDLGCTRCEARDELYDRMAMYIFSDCQPCDELDNPDNPRQCNDCGTCAANNLYVEICATGWKPKNAKYIIGYPVQYDKIKAHDGLFEEMKEKIRKTAEYQFCGCRYTMLRWQHTSNCPVKGAKALLAKIEEMEK